MKNFHGFIAMMLLFTLAACVRVSEDVQSETQVPVVPVEQGEEQKTISSSVPLSEITRHILYEKGTESPFSSPLLSEHRAGTFVAADTGEPLFRSEAKFDSGTGWPSFYEPVTPDAVTLEEDRSHGMVRIEVRTKHGSHLGHVFDDGPQPTGKRFCINGAALRFVPDATPN